MPAKKVAKRLPEELPKVLRRPKKAKRRLPPLQVTGENGQPVWADDKVLTDVPQIGKDTPERSSLPLSRSLPRGRMQAKSPGRSLDLSYSWREQKLLDACSFNQGAERHFCAWLAGKLQSEEFNAVSVAWVLANAAFELDVSIETIKRYVAKHTADAAEFKSDRGMLTLRGKK